MDFTTALVAEKWDKIIDSLAAACLARAEALRKLVREDFLPFDCPEEREMMEWYNRYNVLRKAKNMRMAGF